MSLTTTAMTHDVCGDTALVGEVHPLPLELLAVVGYAGKQQAASSSVPDKYCCQMSVQYMMSHLWHAGWT